MALFDSLKSLFGIGQTSTNKTKQPEKKTPVVKSPPKPVVGPRKEPSILPSRQPSVNPFEIERQKLAPEVRKVVEKYAPSKTMEFPIGAGLRGYNAPKVPSYEEQKASHKIKTKQVGLPPIKKETAKDRYNQAMARYNLRPFEAKRAEQIFNDVISKAYPEEKSASLKVPFLPIEIKASEAGGAPRLIQENVKGIVEWPERTAKTLYQIASLGTKLTPTEREQIQKDGKISPTVETSIDEFKKNINEDPYFSKHPYEAFSLAFFSGALDISAQASILENSIKKQLSSLPKTVKEVEEAKIAMGFEPDKTITSEQIRIQRNKLARITHPDTGGTSESFSKMQKYYDILQNEAEKNGGIIQGINDRNKLGNKIAETLNKDVSDFFRTPEGTPYVGTKGLLPEQAGKIPAEPYQPYRQPKVGLSTREIKEIPIEETKQLKNLYHGSDNGKLKIDNHGNINLGTTEEGVRQFGKTLEINTSNFNIKDVETIGQMSEMAKPENKQQYIDQGIDILKSGDHAIVINTDKFVKETGLPVRENIRAKSVGELAGEQSLEQQTKVEEPVPTAEWLDKNATRETNLNIAREAFNAGDNVVAVKENSMGELEIGKPIQSVKDFDKPSEEYYIYSTEETGKKMAPSLMADLEYRRFREGEERLAKDFEKEQEIITVRETDLSFNDSEKEFGYQNFKDMVKVNENLLNAGTDDTKLKQIIADSKALSKKLGTNIVDDYLFSGARDISNDDLLELFKERYESELELKEKAKGKTPSELRDLSKKQAEKIIKQYNSKVLKPTTPAETKRAVRRLKGEPSPFVRKRETTLLKDRLRNQATGARKARTFTRAEIKQSQNELTNIIKQSELDANDKAKFLATIKNIQTREQLLTAIPDIERRISDLETKSERRKLKYQIKEELKKSKVKMVNGKPVGKYTPEVQKVLDLLRSASNITKADAELRIINNLEKYPDIPPIDIALENKILTMLTEDSSIEELQTILRQIQQMKKTGNIINELKKFNIQSENQTLQDLVVERITGGKGIARGKETFGDRINKQNIINSLKTIGKRWVVDWKGQLDILDFNNPAGDKILSKKFGTLEQDNQYKKFQNNFNEDIKSAISEAYNIENKELKIHKKIGDLSEEINLGKFKNTSGVEQELIMTKDEIIKRWMELQDPSLKESFVLGNRYSPEIISIIERQMTSEDKAFAQKQFDMYKAQWEKINPIYNTLYGIDLPFNEFYSPIRRKGYKVDETAGMGEFLTDAVDRKALSSSSFKSRVQNNLPIEIQSSIHALERHITETNYFVAWAEKIRELKSVFGDNNVREAIRQEFGQDMLKAVNNTIDDFITNGNRGARRYKAIDFFRKKFAIGQLMIKPVIGIKQMVSQFAYLEKLSVKDFTLGAIDFWKNPIKNTKILNEESVLIKTRGSNMERDIKAAMETNTYKRFSLKHNFINTAMMSVHLGDKGAILVGSWSMRRAMLKQGKDLPSIIRAYEDFSAETQQSSDLSRQSEVQRGGSFEQLFTLFKSSQRQYMQKELNAVKSLFQKGGFGKENIKKVAKALVIYHILLPVLFQYVANLGGWDEDDKKEYLRAGILGSTNGVFIFGDIANKVIRAVLGLRVWDNEIPIEEIGNDVVKAVQEIDPENITSEDVWSAIKELSSAANTVGVPASQVKNLWAGAGNIIDGNIKSGVAELLGWSAYFAEEKSKKKKGILPELPKVPKLPELPKLPKLPKI